MNSVVGKIRSQRGASLLEYSVVFALLVGALAAISYGLMIAGAARTKASIGTTNNMAPCDSRLNALRGNSGALDIDPTPCANDSNCKAVCY